jgi:hypothetical protein
MTERWLPVVGFEGYYEVSDMGNVRSILRRKGSPAALLKPWVNKRGYRAVGLSAAPRKLTREVHALVASAFLGPRPDGHEVRHLNGENLDCRLANLSYGTRSENTLDRVRHGTHHMSMRAHCKRGHEFTESNTIRRSARPNTRLCRECRRISNSRSTVWAEQ